MTDTDLRAARPRKGGTWTAGRALLDSLMDAGLVESIGGPLASSWWHKIGTALGERGYAVVPLSRIEAEAAPDLRAALERLRKLIEAELELIPDKAGAFDSGAAAAYNYVLSEWPDVAALAAPTADGLDRAALDQAYQQGLEDGAVEERLSTRAAPTADGLDVPKIECLCGDVFDTIPAMDDHLHLVHEGFELEPSREPGEEG